MKTRKGSLLALMSALMAATSASSASAWENPLENPYLDEPLEVCDQGSFFVGGVPKVTKYAAGPTAGDAQQITIGQAYVQFQVPKTRRQWPIVFVHGSSHTGAALDSTPDGKEGWHSYAVRHNLASFVIDQPGRAAWLDLRDMYAARDRTKQHMASNQHWRRYRRAPLAILAVSIAPRSGVEGARQAGSA